MLMLVAIRRERGAQLKKYYDDPQYNVAFERCVDVMTRLILKYGPAILEKHRPKDLESDQNEFPMDVESEKFEIAA